MSGRGRDRPAAAATGQTATALLDIHGAGDERWGVGWNEVLVYGVFE